MIEPNCDMPWEIYLDWLQDQGNEDLRGLEVFNLSLSYWDFWCYFNNPYSDIAYGDGADFLSDSIVDYYRSNSEGDGSNYHLIMDYEGFFTEGSGIGPNHLIGTDTEPWNFND